MKGLATDELYRVCLDPVRLDPNAALKCISDSIIITEHANTDNGIKTLREDFPVGFKQTSLACILHFHHMDLTTMIDALLA